MSEKSDKYVELRHPFLVPPGKHVQMWMMNVRMGTQEFASRMGTSMQTVNKLLKGDQALTPDMAQRLERVTGAPASFWSKLEANYRNELARRASYDEKSAKEWIKKFPTTDLVKRKALPADFRKMSVEEKREELLKFFGVADEKAYENSFNERKFAARTVKGVTSSMPALEAWIQLALKEADKVTIPDYDADKFSALLDQVSGMTVSLESEETTVDSWLLALRDRCLETGVALLFIRSLKGMCHVNGVTTWRNGHPVIVLSLYGRSIDRILFSFLHEAGHVIKHQKTLTYVTCEENAPAEEEADRFAADKLLPRDCNKAIEETQGCSKALESLAADYGVYSGLVIGRYCHLHGFDKHSAYLSSQIRRFAWKQDQWKLA